ncbi:hypothetical protein HID58_052511, partial [Brassica napus]
LSHFYNLPNPLNPIFPHLISLYLHNDQSVGFLFHEWWLDKSQNSWDSYYGVIELISKSDRNPYRRYYLCLHAAQRRNDSLHFRQPWVFGVHEEVQRLRKRMNKMADEIEEIKELMSRLKTGLHLTCFRILVISSKY